MTEFIFEVNDGSSNKMIFECDVFVCFFVMKAHTGRGSPAELRLNLKSIVTLNVSCFMGFSFFL